MYCFPDLCIYVEDEEILQDDDIDEDEEVYKWTEFHYYKEQNMNYNSSDKHIFRKKLATIEQQTGEVLDFETFQG